MHERLFSYGVWHEICGTIMEPGAINRMHSCHITNKNCYLMEGEMKTEKESIIDEQGCHDFQEKLPERRRR